MTRGVSLEQQLAKRRGYWTSHMTPYGYRQRGPRPETILVPDDNAAHVRFIFDQFAAGMSAREIVDGLNAAAATPPSNAWTTESVLTIARNPIYVGLLRDADQFRVAAFDGIVDEATWDAAQVAKRMNQRVPAAGRQTRRQQMREAFEAGYWHGVRAPRGTCPVGEWPRRILEATPDTQVIVKVLEAIASEASTAEILTEAARLVGAPSRRGASRELRRAIQKDCFHPALAGYAVWGHGTADCLIRSARWGPMIPRALREAAQTNWPRARPR